MPLSLPQNRLLAPILPAYQALGWQVAVGASGTVQAMQEILIAQGMDETITLERLEAIMQQAVVCGRQDQLTLVGLAQERRAGISIRFVHFDRLVSGAWYSRHDLYRVGALREGVLYSMLPQLQESDVPSPHNGQPDGALPY